LIERKRFKEKKKKLVLNPYLNHLRFQLQWKADVENDEGLSSVIIDMFIG